MKQYNLNIVFLFSVFCLMFACTEEDTIKKNQVEEGIPTTLKFSFAVNNLKISTRAMSDEAEKNINDLYVFVFNEDGTICKTKKYYTTDPKDVGDGTLNGSGSLSLETTSGNSLIYAVANVVSNELEDLKYRLGNIEDLKGLEELTTSLKSESINRSMAALVMSGKYGVDGHCEIPPSNSTLSGVINLERLDSRIKFVLKTGENVTFNPISWKVYNVPKNSRIINTKEDIDDKSVFDTDEYVQFERLDATGEFSSYYNFEFYMLENLKESLIVDGKKASNYIDRESQYKEDFTNPNKLQQTVKNGAFIYAPSNATYVEIKGKMNIGNIFADVKYIVHLGYIDGDASDFHSKRNYKYTYTLTLNGVNDIIVEVKGEDGGDPYEKNPGVEGDVVDATTKIYDLDSHFNAFNIKLTKGAAVNFQVITPFANVSNKDYISGSPAKEDIDWVEFIETTNFRTLAKYGGTKYNIRTLNEFLKTQTGGEAFFTVYVNEYYYQKPPKGQSWGNNAATYWHHFVNETERKMMIEFNPQYSADGASSYAEAKYLIRQKSIQTCYNTNVDNALGLEHLNESGAVKWLDDSKTISLKTEYKNGLKNQLEQLVNSNYKKWSEIINYEYDENSYKGGVGSSSKKSAYIECLQRNRDEDGNGAIDPYEVKWYMPARNQLTNMWIGARSLSNPLFDYTQYSKVESADYKDVHVWTNSQYVDVDGTKTSSPVMIWAEEGASVGGKPMTESMQIRCVRNLGVDAPKGSTTNEVINSYSSVNEVYSYDSFNKTFTLNNNLDVRSIRNGYIERGEQVYTELFDSNNLPYKKFKVASKDLALKSNSQNSWKVWNPTENSSLCSNYSEGSADKGSWRAPNQRELLIMFTANEEGYFFSKPNGLSNPICWWSRTGSRYDKTRHFAVDRGTTFAFPELGGWNSLSWTMRCVKDVK